MAYQQLALFAYPMIYCSACGSLIRDLNDLRSPCSESENGRHLVSNNQYFTLYRNTDSASLTANLAR
jgi:hypothetical protein